MTNVVGYFVYVRTNRGTITSEKYGIERVGMPLSKHLDQRDVCAPFPLTADEFKLSLGELAAKYPYVS